MSLIVVILLGFIIYTYRDYLLGYFNNKSYQRNTPISHQKGQDFEDFIESVMFPNDQYILVDKTHDYHENHYRYIESSLNPDFKFRSRRTNREFYIEAKYRSGLDHDGKLNFCSDKQFIRYKEIDMHTSVFIAVGLGGVPQQPEQLYLIPLSSIKYNSLYPSQFTQHPFFDLH